MKDNSVICSAIRLADQAIRKAMTSPNSNQPEITLALGTLRYVERAVHRQGDELKITKFTMVEPAQKMESLKDLTGTEFSEQARSVLDALGVLKGICGCPN